jgi:hypothetical protein
MSPELQIMKSLEKIGSLLEFNLFPRWECIVFTLGHAENVLQNGIKK